MQGRARFQVRHFGITTFGPTSSFAILKRIRKVVEDNPDIRVWNLSVGSGLEYMDGVNRCNDFIDMCQTHQGIVHPVVPVVRADAYQQATGEVVLA